MKTYLIILFLFAIGCFLSPCHAQSKMYDIYDMDDVLDSLKKNGFEVFIDSRVEITPESVHAKAEKRKKRSKKEENTLGSAMVQEGHVGKILLRYSPDDSLYCMFPEFSRTISLASQGSGEVYYTEYDESRPDMFYINDDGTVFMIGCAYLKPESTEIEARMEMEIDENGFVRVHIYNGSRKVEYYGQVSAPYWEINTITEL